ncbi:MAG: flavin reductase [bacterium]
MTGQHREISADQLTDSAFKLIGTDWMLVTAGAIESFNSMTASWGGLGVLWNRKVAWCVIRPQRYTYQFTEKSDTFTLTFFEERYRNILKYCGTKSGRDVDKIKHTGLTPLVTCDGSVYFEQARLVLECRKIYVHDLDPANFLDTRIHDEYPDKDYHRLYMGEVIRCLTQ